MFNSLASSRSFSHLSRTSYGDTDDDNDENDNANADDSRDMEHQDADDEEDSRQEDLFDQVVDDVGYDEYEEEFEDDEQDNFAEIEEEEEVLKNDLDVSTIPGRRRQAPATIIEPPEFILGTSDLLEAAQDVLEPFDELEDGVLLQDQGPIGRHILSEAQRIAHLRKISYLFISSLTNFTTGLNNERMDDALKLASLLLPLHFPPPLDPSAVDLKSNSHLLRNPLPSKPPSLTLINWLNTNDVNPDADHLLSVTDYEPNSALHADFWPLLQKLALRCRLPDFLNLISSPHWEITDPFQHGARVYSFSAVGSIQRVVRLIRDIASSCPAIDFFPITKTSHQSTRPSKKTTNSLGENIWDTSSLDWRLWRSKILKVMTEIDQSSQPDPYISIPDKASAPTSTSSLFRSKRTQAEAVTGSRTSSLLPYDMYQDVRIILQIFLGDKPTILNTADNWMEAVAALVAFHDETGSSGEGMDPSRLKWNDVVQKASNAYIEEPSRKIARYFHFVTDEALPVPALNGLQKAIGDVLARRIPSALYWLSKKSLLVASSSAEIMGWSGLFDDDLGHKNMALEQFDDEVLNTLNIQRETPGTMEQLMAKYALALGDLDVLRQSSDGVVEGWEVGVMTLRRADTAYTRSIASRLIKSVRLDVDNPDRAQRVSDICLKYDFIDERRYISSKFAEKLLSASQIGSSLLYYSKAESRAEIHDIMSGYVQSALLQGQVQSSDREKDGTFQNLLVSPDALAEDDLLRREISGFAALRNYFGSKKSGLFLEAAKTLVVLILSAGEKIDGGILHADFDSVLETRDIAGLMFELIHGTSQMEFEHTGDMPLYDYLDNEEVFSVLKVIETLFTVGGETLESIQQEFLRVTESRDVSWNNGDFLAAIASLRSSLARKISRGWLIDETAKNFRN